ncbi:OmpH family outer membrane protein [Bizionia paragorgiae]|uniref:Periplasmic chaperone for outer membrane proteins Skp n=1 Tax=Bizionia paragorgiae TaxID=283786 RepID=A0A1H3W562_BIZPA|nr:OmpH family outer membrane protein [Bizionia paragorgiae]MDX1271905.1 OmpH family outer membrane protein [Bizionia paragorgiae]SDZ81482.1 periplasmic chaperone for outer membrane proteins Skp [Bizionia paragorgiae]
MKYYLVILFACLALTSCEKQKIAFVDNGKVINEIQEKLDLEAKYKIKEDAFNAKADSLDEAIQAEVLEFQKNVEKMSRANQEKNYQALVQKKQAQDQKLQFERQQITQEFRTDVDSVIARVKTFVKDYGKANGYTYILGTSEVAATVLYGSEENDLTNIVIEALNKEYKK